MRNIKFLYYASNYMQLILPKCMFSIERELRKFDKLTEQQQSYVLDRVDYYCKIEENSRLTDQSKLLSDHLLKNKDYRSVYFFDSYACSRYFDDKLRWQYRFGDVRDVFDSPTIVKSRPLCLENINSVMLKLNKVRHFNFINDSNSYDKKDNKIVFRGKVKDKPHRIDLVKRYIDHPMCDFGAVDKEHEIVDLGVVRDKLSIKEHLKSKFIVAIEGNDVATNLKWIMNSNSLAVMCRPTCETWFMEGRLVGGEHYIEVDDSYGNIEEVINYYIDRPALSKEIITNAKEYVRQFRNRDQERLISLMVLWRYFQKTGQI